MVQSVIRLYFKNSNHVSSEKRKPVFVVRKLYCVRESYFSHFWWVQSNYNRATKKERSTSLIRLGTSREIRPTSHSLVPVTTVRALKTFLQVKIFFTEWINELCSFPERPFLFLSNLDCLAVSSLLRLYNKMQ